MISSSRAWGRLLKAARGTLVLCASALTACGGGGGGGGGGITEPEKPDLAVATVAVSAPAASLATGATLQLTATARNASGATLAGRTFSWQSSNDAVASVSSTGLVTGHAAGPVTITVGTDGKTASVDITVVTPVASRVAIQPRFASFRVGGSQQLQSSAYDASDESIVGAAIEWESLDPSVATVGNDGVVSGLSAGQVKVVARMDASADTALVVVLGPEALLSTAFSGGDIAAEAAPGTTVTFAIVLDLTQVSANGDLGSAQLELEYDPAVLAYQSATAGVSGAAELNVPSPGTFKLSFAGTEPQGSATVTLATLTFHVAGDAEPGVPTTLSLRYVEAPTSTDFSSYAVPVSIGGQVRVVAP